MKKMIAAVIMLSSLSYADQVVLTCNNLKIDNVPVERQKIDATITIDGDGQIAYEDQKGYGFSTNSADMFNDRIIMFSGKADYTDSKFKIIIFRARGEISVTKVIGGNIIELYKGFCVKSLKANAI